MKIQFLGTAAAEGVPSVFCECGVCKRSRETGGRNIRTRSQACVDGRLLIDLPPDTYLHALRDGLPLERIHSCIITHDHEDHLYEREIINRMKGFAYPAADTPLTFYCTPPAGAKLTAVIREYHLDQQKRAAVQIIEPFAAFEAEGYEITPLKADHDPLCDPVIYLIRKDGKCLLYSNDTGYYPDETWDYFKEHPQHIDLASFDCTTGFSEGVHNHMGLSTVVRVKERLSELGCIDQSSACYVNHFSHNGKASYDDMVPAAGEHGLLVTYDGLSVEF